MGGGADISQVPPRRHEGPLEGPCYISGDLFHPNCLKPSILTCAKWAVGLTSARCPPGGMGGHLKGQCATTGRGIGEASVLMCSVSSLPQQPAQLGLDGYDVKSAQIAGQIACLPMQRA